MYRTGEFAQIVLFGLRRSSTMAPRTERFTEHVCILAARLPARDRAGDLYRHVESSGLRRPRQGLFRLTNLAWEHPCTLHPRSWK